MNLSRLLRTALFSVLGLFLAGGLMTVQAQDIVIDEDDGDDINTELSNAQDGDVVEIVASTYDANVAISTANTSVPTDGSLTIRAAVDGTDNDVRLHQLEVLDGITVTIQSDGNGGFFNLIEQGASPSFNLWNGTADIEDQGALELADGITVQQSGNGALTSNSPTFNGSVAAILNAGNGALDVSSDPNVIPASSEDTEVEVTGSGDPVTLPSDITIANVDGANTGVDNALQVSSTGEIELNGGTVSDDVDNTSGGTITADGSVTFQGSINNSDSGVGSTAGTITANAGLTFEGQINNSGGGTLDFQSGTSTYDPTAGTLDNGDTSSEITIADGATLEANSADGTGNGSITVLTNDGGVTGAGTLDLVGDGNDTFTIDVSGAGNPNEILADNSGTGGTAAGTITNDRPLTIEDNGTGSITTGDVTANAAVDFNESGGDSDITTGNIDANAGVSFVAGATPNSVTTGSIMAGGTVSANGIGDGSNAFDINGDLTQEDGNTVNIEGSVVELSGGLTQETNNTELLADNNTELALDGDQDASLDHRSLFTVGALSISKSSGATLNLNEAIEVSGDGSVPGKNVSTGNVDIQSDAIFADNLIVSGSGGLVTVDEPLVQNEDAQGNTTFLIFNGSGQNISATESIDNVRVSGGNNVTLNDDVDLDVILQLRDGGIDVDGNALIPTTGALIERNLTNDTDITDGAGGGSVGGNPHDLTYFASSGTSAKNATLEFSPDVRDLTVEGGATAQLTEDEDVARTLTVNSGGQIADDGNGARELDLKGSEVTHSIAGTVEQSNGNEVTVKVSGDNATIEGSTDDGDDAIIENLTVDASGAAIASGTPLQQINGDVTINQDAGLDLALSAADGNADDDDADAGDDQTVAGNVTANGSLTISSRVELTNNDDTVLQVNGSGTEGSVAFASDLFVTGEGATVDANDDGTADATPFTSSGGRLVFDKNESGNEQSFGTAGEIVPRVAINADPNDPDDDLLLTENVATDTELDADEEIDLNGNTFEVSGVEEDGVTDVALDADVIGSGDFRAVGTTVQAEQDLSISNFTSDAGSGNTVTLVSNVPGGGSGPFTVTVGSAFELASGSLSHGATEIDIGGSFSYTGSGSPDTEISSTGGFVDFDNSGLTLSLNNAIKVSNLRVTQDTDLGTDGVDLTIGQELELDDNFDASGGGSVVMDNNSDVQRLAGTDTGGSDPLEEALTAAGDDTFNVIYGEGNDNHYDSHFELVSDNVSSVTIQAGSSGSVFLDDNSNVLTGDVVLNTLDLQSGDLDYGRQPVIEDGGLVQRTDDSGLNDADNNTADGDTNEPPALQRTSSDAAFTLEYDGDGAIEATGREFLDTSGDIALITRMDGADVDVLPGDRTVSSFTVENTSNSDETDLEEGLTGNMNQFTLTVEGDATIRGGDVMEGAGTTGLVVNGNVTINDDVGTADLSSNTSIGGNLTLENTTNEQPNVQPQISGNVFIEGNTTVNTGVISSATFETAGDLTVESGTAFSQTTSNITLRFDGTDQVVEFSTPEVVQELELNQPRTTGTIGDEKVTLRRYNDQVNSAALGVTDPTGAARGLIDFNNGVLTVPADENQNTVFVARGDIEPNSGTFQLGTNNTMGTPSNNFRNAMVNRDDVGDDDLSHISARLQIGIPAGTPGGGGLTRGAFAFQVGSAPTTGSGGSVAAKSNHTDASGGEYRPAEIVLTTNDPTEASVNIRIGHVNENPGGTENLDNISSVGSFPDQHWFVDASRGLGASQTFDLALETGTAPFVDQFEDAANLRIIRRFGDVSNEWRLQGSDDSYDNNLKTRTEDGETKQFTDVRTQNSTGGVTTSGARFTIGLPTRVPAFTAKSFSPSDMTIDEGETLTANFRASSRDLGEELTALDTTDIPSDAEPFVSAVSSLDDSSLDTDSTSTDSLEVEFAPDNSFVSSGSASRDVKLFVTASDPNNTVRDSFTVTVNDVNRGPAFTQTLPDTTVQDGEQLAFTYEASDPDAEDLAFDLAEGPEGAAIDSASGEFSWTPSFDQTGETFDVVASVSDGDTTVTSDTAAVTVEPSLAKGDVDGDRDTTAQDASFALLIFLDKETEAFDGSDPTSAQQFAADFNGDGEVTPFDASRILDAFLGGGSQTAVTASAGGTQSARGAVRLESTQQDGNAAQMPIVLSEDAAGVKSVGLEVELGSDASVAEVSTDLPEGWIADYSEKSGGTIKIGMAGSSPIGAGQIGTIQLKNSGGSSIEPEGKYQLNAGSKQDLDVRLAPEEFALNGNYPNPVQSQTTIEYSLKEAADVRISLYDALGREVAVLVNGQKSAGRFEANVDASNLSSGVYFYRIEAGDFTASKKMTVVR